MYWTADSCAERCATKTNHKGNPINRPFLSVRLPINVFGCELMFTPKP